MDAPFHDLSDIRQLCADKNHFRHAADTAGLPAMKRLISLILTYEHGGNKVRIMSFLILLYSVEGI